MITSTVTGLLFVGWVWLWSATLNQPRYALAVSDQRAVVINGRGYIGSRPFASR